MIRRFGSGRLKGEKDFNEDVNPMDGVSNMADVMLVFACGIMMALILNWNVDVKATTNEPVPVEQGQEVKDIQNFGEGEGVLSEDGTYEELGKVYRDPKTGSLYMVETNE